jgi:hypothetical protein
MKNGIWDLDYGAVWILLERVASIFRVEKILERRKALAVCQQTVARMQEVVEGNDSEWRLNFF